tara:strand:+ start:18511 stop:19191 length:681 start_codon:yes stop_codon:yes gene_type:complete
MNKYKFNLFNLLFILIFILSCGENASNLNNSINQDQISKAETSNENITSSNETSNIGPTGKTNSETRAQGDIKTVREEASDEIAPEIEHNPKFQDCAGLRVAQSGGGRGDVRGHTLCTEENLRVLVQDYIDAINNNDFNLIKKYIDESSLLEHTPIFEEKSNKISSDGLNLTWEEEEPPAKRGSKRASVFINVSAENFSERWLVDFIELGKKGGGIWYISAVAYDK